MLERLHDATGIQHYTVSRNGDPPFQPVQTSNLCHTDSTPTLGQSYTYTVTATDGVGNVSPAAVSALIGSGCYPHTPTVTLAPVSQAVKPGLGASFTVSVKNEDSPSCAPTTFTLGHTGTPSGSTLTPATLRLDAGQSGTATLSMNTATAGTFIFQAQAVDSDGIEPDHSTAGASGDTILLIDNTPPTPPQNCSGSINAQGQVTLNWSAATDTPSGVDKYLISRNGAQIGQTTGSQYADNPPLGPTYSYAVTAIDRAGNVSSSCTVNVATTCTAANPMVTLTPVPLAAKLSVVTNYTVMVANNDTGPCAATTFTLASSASSSKVTKTWSSASLSVNPGQSNTTTLGVKTTTAGTYTVSVKATDSDGKAPNHSTAITGSAQFIGDSTAPSAPTNLQAAFDANTGAVQLNWNAATDSGSGIQFYTVTRDGSTTLGQTSGSTYTDPAAVLGTTYSYTVKATDKAGNVSLQSNTVQLLAGCSAKAPLVTLAPSSQLVKAGVAANYTVTVVNQDGLTYCPATTFTLSYTGTPTGTLTPTSLPLSPGQSGTATLQVKTSSSGSFPIQVNTADNDGVAPSHPTGSGSATFVSDGAAPTVPSGLKATVSTGQIALTWNASTDALSAVQSYLVYRNNTQIAEVASPTTSYTDTAVVKGTSYTYKVAAKDVFGYVSAQSSSVKATAQ